MGSSDVRTVSMDNSIRTDDRILKSAGVTLTATIVFWLREPIGGALCGARKAEPTAMANVKEVSVTLTGSAEAAPACAINHSVPAVVFAHGGYMGNYFHDFADSIVPLFATARQFHGEVQFLIADYKIWWHFKYRHIVEKLTMYEIIDLDKNDRVLCYPHVFVGLHSHDDLKVDPARTPNGCSTADYAEFIRMAYSFERESAIRMGEQAGKKPRLLLIARKGTRKFTSVKEIVRMDEELSYEVVVADAKFEANVSEYAATVNSCDVMLGVHGSGLTNFFFLPTNAVVIQVVPLGNLEGMAKDDYGDPPMAAKLHYLQYTISQEESTLSERYPRDDPVFRDPDSIHKLGWLAMANIYMKKQNVKIDSNRFRPVLKKALDLLRCWQCQSALLW